MVYISTHRIEMDQVRGTGGKIFFHLLWRCLINNMSDDVDLQPHWLSVFSTDAH